MSPGLTDEQFNLRFNEQNPEVPQVENQTIIKGLRMSVSKKKPMKRFKSESEKLALDQSKKEALKNKHQ
jgi:hypothetical protein